MYLLDTMIGTMWVIVYTHLQGGIHNYQRSTFVHTSALNFSVINKPMSERYVNKIYSELTTTVGALATTGLMMYIYQSAPTLVMMGLTLLSDIVMISLWLLLTFSEL